MKHKLNIETNSFFVKIPIALIFIFSCALFAKAQDRDTVQKCYSGPTVSYTNTMGTQLPTVNFTSGIDFPAGHKVLEVVVEIVWSKTDDGSCTATTGTPPNLSDVGFKIQGPTGGSKFLATSAFTGPFASPATSASFTGSSNVANHTITFRDGQASLLPATNPVSGGSISASPNGDLLSFYRGADPAGNWSVGAIDDIPSTGPALCIHSYCITLITCNPASLTAVCKPNITKSVNASGLYITDFSDLDNGSNLTCFVKSITFSENSFNCTDIGSTVPVTMTITDWLNNTETCVSDITMVDEVKPVIDECSIFPTVAKIYYLDASGNATIYGSDFTATDNCAVASLLVQNPISGLYVNSISRNCTNRGPNNIRVRATDINGNMSGTNPSYFCTIRVSVYDTIAPVISGCPGNQTIASCQFTLPDYTGMITASDNCTPNSSLIISQSPPVGTVVSSNTTVTISVSDAQTAIQGGANVSTCSFDLTLNADVTAPTAVCQNISVNLNASGNASIVAADLDGGSTDNCSTLTLSASKTSFTCADVGTNNVTLTVTDGGGNSSTCVAVVTVVGITSSLSAQTNLVCNGGATGAATVSFIGGTAPYTYSWSPSGGTATTATGLTAGTYTCTITDANSCTKTQSVSITEPVAIVSSVTSQTNATCSANGAATVAVSSGGTAPFTYAWTPSGGTAATATNLSTGAYNCTITDDNGCTTSQAVSILGTVVTNTLNAGTGSLRQAVINSVDGDTICFDPTLIAAGSDSIVLTSEIAFTKGLVFKGLYNATDTLYISGGGTNRIFTISLQTASIKKLILDSLVVINGSETSGGAIRFRHDSLFVRNSVFKHNKAIGDGGAIFAIANPYTPNGSFISIHNSTFVSNSSNNSGGAITMITGEKFITLDITNSNISNNSASQPGGAIFMFNGSSSVSSIKITNSTLSGNSANGGRAISVESNNNSSINIVNSTISGNTGTPGSPAINVAAPSSSFLTLKGTIITNNGANSISNNGGSTITSLGYNIFSDATMSGSVASDLLSVSAAALNLGPLQNNGGTTFTMLPLCNSVARNAGDASDASNAQNTTICGTRDIGAAENCASMPAAFISSQTNIACNGATTGAATLSAVTGGVAPYTYDWTGTPTGDATNSVSGLTAGAWTCTVTDANGCTITATATITEPAAITTYLSTQTNVSCNGGSTGAASIATPTGGTAPYTYNWTPGNPTGDGTTAVTGLTAGIWTCTITDDNGCTGTQNVTITQPATIAMTQLTSISTSCNSGADGEASVNAATGGTGPYTYNWTPGNPTGDGTTEITGLTTGTWTCTVTDANGCTKATNITVTQPTAITSSITTQTNVGCNAGATGSATAAAAGGTAPYDYIWSNSAVGATVSGISAGVYTCYITDDNGCVKNQSVTITEPTAITSTISAQTNVSCNGGANGTATVSASNGTAPYSYSWSPSGGTVATATGLSAGTYTCTITDANSCTATSQTVTITQPTAIAMTALSQVNNVCTGDASGSATVNSATGGTGPYTYNWTPGNPTGDGTTTVTGLTTGAWTCTATDANGCSVNSNFTILENDAIAPTAVCQNITAYLDGTGNITIAASALDGGSTDNCSGVTFSATPITFTCADLGPNNVTLTVTDGNSNTATCVAVVTIADTISPIATCPGNQTETPDANCQFTLVDYTSLVSATDNCSTAFTYTQSPAAGTLISGTTTITMTANDGNGNSSTCTFDVILDDATAPTAVCQNVNAYLNASGAATIVAADLDGGSTDNCAGLTLSASTTAFTCANIGANTVTLAVTDGNSNSSTCTATVTVIDTISPIVTCPGIQTENPDASCQFTLPDYTSLVTASDNCGTAPTITQSPVAGTIIAGTTVITMTATDANGNSSTCSFDVLLDDNTAPTVVCQNINAYVNAAGTVTITTTDVDGGSTDNCAGLTLSLSQATFTCADLGPVNVTLTGTDANNNTATCVAVVTVIDTITPIVTCLADQNVSLSTTCDYMLPDYSTMITVVENCTSTFTQSPIAGTVITSNTLVNFTAADASGNTTSCSFNVNVTDTDAPVIATCPADTVLFLDENCEVIVPDYSTMLSILDNCDNSVVITQSPLAGTVYSGKESINATVTATDATGNASICDFTIDIDINENSGCLEKLVITDLISPNGDGKNDFWIIEELDAIKDCSVMVFNRWGQKVFESKNYDNTWGGTYNGEQLPDGSYYYAIECDGEIQYKGGLTILKLKK